MYAPIITTYLSLEALSTHHITGDTNLYHQDSGYYTSCDASSKEVFSDDFALILARNIIWLIYKFQEYMTIKIFDLLLS